MDISERHPLMHIDSTTRLAQLLADGDLDGVHLFCSFNYEVLNPRVIMTLRDSSLQSISFNDAQTIYPKLSRSHENF